MYTQRISFTDKSNLVQVLIWLFGVKKGRNVYFDYLQFLFLVKTYYKLVSYLLKNTYNSVKYYLQYKSWQTAVIGNLLKLWSETPLNLLYNFTKRKL